MRNNNSTVYIYNNESDKILKARKRRQAATKFDSDPNSLSKKEKIDVAEIVHSPVEIVKETNHIISSEGKTRYSAAIDKKALLGPITTPEILSFFDVVAERGMNAKEFLDATVLNSTKFIVNNQKGQSAESVATWNEVRKNMKLAMHGSDDGSIAPGSMFLWDLETLGGKNKKGVWNPFGITEFSMKEYDFAKKEFIESSNVNVIVGFHKDDYDILERIKKAIKNDTLDQDEELLVTAKRLAQYGDVDFDVKKHADGYYYATSFPTEKKNNYKNFDVIKQGWDEFVRIGKEMDEEAVNGIRADHKKIVDTLIYSEGKLNKNSMLFGMNTLSHDIPIMHYSLTRWQMQYPELAKYIGGRNLWHIPDEKNVDIFGGESLVANSRGMKALHGGADLSKLKHGLRAQETISDVHYEELKKIENIMAHMADSDTTVLGMMVTHNSEVVDGGGKKSFYNHVNDMIKEDYKDVKEVALEKNKHVLRAKTTIMHSQDGKQALNFAYDEASKDIFLSNNIVIRGNEAETLSYNAGYGINKGQLYDFLGVQELNSKDLAFNKAMTDFAPEFSGGKLFAVKYKILQDDSMGPRRNNNMVNVMLYRTLKEARAAMSNMFDIVGERDGENFKIMEGMEDHFDLIEVGEKNGKTHLEGVTPGDMTDTEKLNRAVSLNTEKQAVSRAEGFIYRDDSYGTIDKIMKTQRELSELLGRNATGHDIAQIMSKRVSEGKIPLNLKEDVYNKAVNVINKNLSTKKGNLSQSRVDNSSTGLNMLLEYEGGINAILEALKGNKEFENSSGKNILFERILRAVRTEATNDFYSNDVNATDSAIAKGITNSTKATMSKAELSQIYEIDYKNINPNRRVINVSTSSPDFMDNILKIDLGEGTKASSRLIKNATNIFFDSTEKVDERAKRYAMEKMFGHMHRTQKGFKRSKVVKDFIKGKDYRNRKFEVELNETEIADVIIAGLQDVKKGNYKAGLLSGAYSFGKNVEGAKGVNEYMSGDAFQQKIPGIVNDVIKNFRHNKLTHDNAEVLAEMLVKQHYIPQNFATNQKSVGKLFNKAQEDLTEYVGNILSSVANLGASTISMQDDGGLFVDFGGETMIIDNIPRIKVNEPTNALYIELGSMKLQLGSIFDFSGTQNNTGIAAKGYSTLGILNKGNMSKVVKNTYQTHGMQRGVSTLQSLIGISLGELRSQPTINGFGGNDIDANHSVDVSRIKNIIPFMFDVNNPASANFINQDFIDSDLSERMIEHLKYTDMSKGLDVMSPEVLRDIIKNVPGFLDIIKNTASVNDYFLEMVDGLGFTLSEGKTSDLVMAKDYSTRNSVMAPFENNKRPPASQTGNTYQIAVDKINAVADEYNISANNVLLDSDVEYKINRTNRVTGNTTADVTVNMGYIDSDSNAIKIRTELAHILADPNMSPEDKAKNMKIYNSLLNTVNVFEQQRAMDSRVYESLMGLQPLKVEKLSVNNNVVDVLEDLDAATFEKQFSSIMNQGVFTKGADGNIEFTQTPGKIIKRGDSGIKWRGFSDSVTDFSSGSPYGILGYNFFDTDGVIASNEIINKVINMNQDLFLDENNNLKTSAESANALIRAMAKEGYKGQYSIEDITAAGYKKVFSGYEKGMTSIVYATTGYHDDRVKKYFEKVGAEDMVSNRVITERTVDSIAYQNISLSNAALKEAGFDSIEALKKAMAVERHTHSSVMFGEIYKGLNMIANDNVAGHNNIGQIYSMGLGNAIDGMTKLLGSQDKAVNSIIDMINNNDEYQFFRNLNTNTLKSTAIDLKNVDGRIDLVGGFKKTMDLAGELDNTRFENLLKHVNSQLVNAGYTGKDLIMRDDLYLINKDGVYEKKEGLYGSFDTMHIEADVLENGVITKKKVETVLSNNVKEVIKFSKDSETKSGVTQEFFNLKQQKRNLITREAEVDIELNNINKDINNLNKKKSNLKNASGEKAKKKRDAIDLELNNKKIQKQMLQKNKTDLSVELDKISGHIDSYSNAVKISKISDTELSILERITVRKSHIEEINSRIGSGDFDADSILSSVAFRGHVHLDGAGKLRFDEEIVGEASLKGFLEPFKARQFFKEGDEEILTEEIVNTLKPHLKEMYDAVTNQYGLTLGEDTADELYKAVQADHAHRFNAKSTSLGQDITLEGMEKAGFETISIRDLPLDTNEIAERNLLVDLGAEFLDKDRYIALPGLGMSYGDTEIKTEAQSQMRGLKRAHLEFTSLGGNVDHEKYSTLQNKVLDKKANAIKSIHDSIYQKNGTLFNHSRIDLNVATSRMKSSGYVTSNSWASLAEAAKAGGTNIAEGGDFAKSAMINGKSIHEWETSNKGSAFFNYKQVNKNMFKDWGYYDEDILRDMGFLDNGASLKDAEDRMDEFLRTKGTMGIGDRYPNIKNESLTVSKYFLNDSLADNEMKDSLGVIMENNGDFDGDSSTNFNLSITKGDKTYTAAHYEAAKMRAEAQGIEDVAQFAVDNKIMDLESFNEFAKIERAYLAKGMSNSGAQSNQKAIEKILKDKIKNPLLQDNSRVMVPGGESILGQKAIVAAPTMPTFEEFNKLSKDTQDLLDKAYELTKNDVFKTTHYDASAKTLDGALTAVKGSVSDDVMNMFNSTALKKVRIDTHAQEIMAKTGLAATGAVNVSMAAVKMAAYQASNSLDDVAFTDFIWAGLDVAEQNVISSKKAANETYNSTAIRDFKVAMNDIFSGKRNDVTTQTSLNNLMEWFDEHGGELFETSYKTMGDSILSNSEKNKLKALSTEEERLTEGAKLMKKRFFGHIEKMSNDELTGSYVSSAKAFGGIESATRLTVEAVGAAAAHGNSLISRLHGALGYRSNELLRLAEIARNSREAASNINNDVRKAFSAPKLSQADINSSTASAAAEAATEGATALTKGFKPGALGMFAIGTAIGLVAGGYSSGNPLNEKSAEQFSQETKPKQVMSIPDFMDQQGGYAYGNSQQGYVINLRADTKKGRKHIENIMTKAAESTVGGAVSINMNIKSKNSGQTDRDIYEYIERNF